MFESLVTIRGKHAYYMKQLTSIELSHDEKISIFKRNLDLYITAAIIGFINDREEEQDLSSYNDASAKIEVEQLVKESKNLEMIFRTIMLLNDSGNADEEVQIRRAFRDDSLKEVNNNHEHNVGVFENYIRGGISILYGAMIENAAVKSDYIKNIYAYLENFEREMQGITDEELEIEVGYR